MLDNELRVENALVEKGEGEVSLLDEFECCLAQIDAVDRQVGLVCFLARGLLLDRVLEPPFEHLLEGAIISLGLASIREVWEETPKLPSAMRAVDLVHVHLTVLLEGQAPAQVRGLRLVCKLRF